MEPNNTHISQKYQDVAIQNVAQSKITQFDDPKVSRILDRKQIQKRLQNLRPNEHERVYNNLTNQNRRLRQQVKDLKQKVEQLMISKKISNPHHKNPLMEEEVKKAKKQLVLKYESMNYLKDELQKAKQTEITEEMRIKVKQQKQQMSYIEDEIKRLTREKQKLVEHLEVNKQSYEEYNPNAKNQDQRMERYKEQNRVLKAKIQELNGEHKVTQKQSKQALDKLYSLKQSEKKFLAMLLQTKISVKKQSMPDITAVDTNQISALQKQVENLKRQKKQTEKELVNEKLIKEGKKQKLQKEARKKLEQHKDLLQKRMKAINQLNLYQAKDKKQREIIYERQHKQIQIEYEERGCQTDKIIPIDFRKQWIGKSEGLVFDDSQVLDYRSHVFIKAFIVYKTQDFIGFVKFFYENSQKKRYESKIPFETSVLRKYESKKYVAKGQAYLKEFKVFLTGDIITGISFTWSDNEVVSEGYELENSTKFIADIQAEERPISMFGSVSFQNKNLYALESLGCEVNKIDNDE